MRRTIHADKKAEHRRNRVIRKKALPSNFQYGLEDKGQELRVRRSSDGRVEQMVVTEEYDKLKLDLATSQAELEQSRITAAQYEGRVLELEESIQEIRDFVGL